MPRGVIVIDHKECAVTRANPTALRAEQIVIVPEHHVRTLRQHRLEDAVHGESIVAAVGAVECTGIPPSQFLGEQAGRRAHVQSQARSILDEQQMHAALGERSGESIERLREPRLARAYLLVRKRIRPSIGDRPAPSELPPIEAQGNNVAGARPAQQPVQLRG